MIWIYMVITFLAMTTLVKGHLKCNFTESTENKLCVGQLGKPLTFHLPVETNTKKKLTHDSCVIIRITNDSEASIMDFKGKERFTYFNKGSFQLNKATKADSGSYTLETYNFTSGELLTKTVIQLEIQAPVSKPVVSQTCLSLEQMKVSCSSEGDGAEIILSLDNNLLIQRRATAKQNALSVVVSLRSELIGNLTCDVQNNVSREQTVIQLTSCSSSVLGHLSVTLVIAVMAGIAFLFLFLAVVVSIKHCKKTPSPVTEGKRHIKCLAKFCM
ncbi:uncharacterized protein LOC125021830 [Mugil cephalus]|uniref:uncharacterized protein LOC125021830 n=1 Tax=Mugil cephalus TaxID=48193 RepID=UPI001FB5C261|nr:uncharacterized protein LOC125021830 [Mugil cephalus]